ncbi:helix-turn-helix domain-containing protein [Variovorax sp. KK3]|uniref:helix-turn-helix domain-containing protein n=1 Tax=Variovorax sp. KK3 TaxID=1855728 RepID=UPI001180D588|nr:helix-turn-helix domain-containing protein [Variovorax sp. KK3]
MTDPCVPHVRTESSSFDAGERFDRWRNGIAGTFNVSVPPGTRAEDFNFDISFWQFGKLLLSDSHFGPRLQTRTQRNIRGDHLDHYRFILQTEGVLRNDADGVRHQVGPGEILVSDMAREESYECDAGANIVVFVPRELLDEALPRAFDLHGFKPRGASANMLADHLRSLVRISSMVSVQQAPALTQATVNLLAASVLPSSVNIDHARPVADSTLLRQVCRYIDLHLTEPDLSADGIAAFFKMSRTTLYRMLEPMGGVGHYVRERRLARVHALLESATSRIYLGRVAEDHGFKSATHFSRAFREQFGYAPNEVRRRVAQAVPGSVQPSLAGAGFEPWIRTLRD